MTADFETRYDELLAQADELTDGPAKLMLLEEAVRLADTHQDLKKAFDGREALIHTATFGGFPEKALVAFTWCLAQSDRDPQTFPDQRILWKYKWIMDSIAGFPQVSRDQIIKMMEDMRGRYLRSGRGMKPIYKLRCDVAIDLGDPKDLLWYLRQWTEAGIAYGNDCVACDRNAHVRYMAFLGNDRKAVEMAAPLLQGRMTCSQVPQMTFGEVLLPLVRMGRMEEAATYHKKGYAMIADNRSFLGTFAQHLTFLVLTDNLPQGVKLFEKHLPWALERVKLVEQFHFYLAVRFLVLRLRDTKQERVQLRLPTTLPCHEENGSYAVAKLFDWIDGACRDLAARFDARNGNSFYTRQIEEQEKLQELIVPFAVV